MNSSKLDLDIVGMPEKSIEGYISHFKKDAVR
jgi:hypothetical protein